MIYYSINYISYSSYIGLPADAYFNVKPSCKTIHFEMSRQFILQ